MKNKVIHCPTEEQAVEVLSILDKQGCKWWASGDSLTEKTRWDWYEEDTCYRIDDKKVYFDSKELYEIEGYQIISATEF